jgi:hypothetical protein
MTRIVAGSPLTFVALAVLLAGCADREPTAPEAPRGQAPAFDISLQSHQVFHITFTSNAFAGERDAWEAAFTPPIADLPGGVMAGQVVHVGRGCPAGVDPVADDPYLADPAGKIALIQRGTCRFDNKIARAQLAGATGVIVYGFDGDETLVVMGGDSPVFEGGSGVIGTVIAIPAVLVAHSTGVLLRDGFPPVLVEVPPPSPPTPAQMLDHVYDAVDLLVESDLLGANLARALYAQLDAARRHIERGNLKGAANTLQAFINHVNSLEAEGVLDSTAADLLRLHAQNLMALLNP